jgi:UDP-glucose 4-epimerase
VRAIVTGGAGFVGSHLVEHLLAEGGEVDALDRQAQPRNLQAVSAHPALRYIPCDLEQPGGENFCRPADVLFHVAGYGEMLAALQHPADYVRANVLGTAHALDLARAAGCRRVVYAASSSCYGPHPPVPTDETADCPTTHPYAISKWLGEEYLFRTAPVYGIEVNTLRFFTVYGDRMRRSDALGPVLNIFLAQKANGRPLTIVGDGTQGRDFVHVQDVARAFVAAATSPRYGEMFNIGAGETQTINRLAELIGGPVVYVPARHGDPHTARANIAKAVRLLHWAPEIPFEDGLGAMLAHVEDWREAPVWTPATMEQGTRLWQELLA